MDTVAYPGAEGGGKLEVDPGAAADWERERRRLGPALLRSGIETECGMPPVASPGVEFMLACPPEIVGERSFFVPVGEGS